MGRRAASVNFDADDIHRSLRRYFAAVLAPPWIVRTERQPVEDDKRRVCVVEPSSGVTTGKHRVSIPQGGVEKIQSYAAMAYPLLGETARESRAEAQSIASLLDQAITIGLVEPQESGPDKNIGGPFRIPVYDYEGVPVVGPDRGGPADPYGYVWVNDLNVRPIQDTLDYLRFTVTCSMRLSWEQGGRIVAAAPLATAMPGTFEPGP